MVSHRIGAVALSCVVFVLASGALVLRAHACDERIQGSCPGAPITNPGTTVLVDDSGAAAPEQRAGRHASGKRRSVRYHRYKHRRRDGVAPAAKVIGSPEPNETAFAEADAPPKSNPVSSARVADGDTAGSVTAPEPNEAQPTLGSPLPSPAPMATLVAPPAELHAGSGPDASLLAPPPALVSASVLAPAAAENVGQAQLQRGPPKAEMTTLRALFLSLAGALVLATAVRLAV